MTGAIGTLSPSTEVLAIMLTTPGAFNRPSDSGLAPWKTTRSPCAITNRKKPWSSRLPVSTRPFGSRHSRLSTTTASTA